MATARSIAHEILDRVFFDGAYSHIALSNALDDSDLSSRDSGLATEITYGVLTWKRTIDAVLGRYVDRPLDDLDRPVLLSLRMAVYQLLFLERIPEHAAVDEAVELTKSHCGKGAAGFTNGVLRSLLRDDGGLEIWDEIDPESRPERYLGLRHSLPDWIAELLIDQFGLEEAMRWAKSFNRRPPYFFRMPFPDDSRASLPDRLRSVDGVPGAFRFDRMGSEIREAVRDHRLVVQDLGSQLVGHFCAPTPQSKILDGCAGLGGKTLLLASLSGADSRIVAVEPKESKLEQLRETAAAIGVDDRIETFHGSLGELPNDRGPFDIALVDAPCTGLGVIRRHPETRWRRSPEDVDELAAIQRRLLNRAAELVAPGGTLVYSVCTFVDEEGPDQIDRFVQEHGEFHRDQPPGESPVDWSRFTDERGDLRTNPANHDADAFYAARVKRGS